jgi:hypothetical protein
MLISVILFRLEQPKNTASICIDFCCMKQFYFFRLNIFDLLIFDMFDSPIGPFIYCFQDVAKIEKVPKRSLPIICFRDGSPPLPDALNTSLKYSAISGRSPI